MSVISDFLDSASSNVISSISKRMSDLHDICVNNRNSWRPERFGAVKSGIKIEATFDKAMPLRYRYRFGDRGKFYNRYTHIKYSAR